MYGLTFIIIFIKIGVKKESKIRLDSTLTDESNIRFSEEEEVKQDSNNQRESFPIPYFGRKKRTDDSKSTETGSYDPSEKYREKALDFIHRDKTIKKIKGSKKRKLSDG